MDLKWLNLVWPLCEEIAGDNAEQLYKAFKQDKQYSGLRSDFMQGQPGRDKIKETLKDIFSLS